MCNLTHVYEQLDAGLDVYIINDYTDHAVHYSPKFGDYLETKGRRSLGGITSMLPRSDEMAFEDTLGGEIVSKEEYDRF